MLTRVSAPCHLDARCLEGQRTGIGIFTAEVVKHWPEAPPLRPHSRADHPRLWHLAVAREVRREGGRYLSTDSLIVPVLLGRRATVTIHDLSAVLHPQSQQRRTRLAYRLLLGAACRRVGAVVVPSAATRDDLLARHPRVAPRVHLVPYAARVLPPATQVPASVRAPFVLHTGTHEPRKGVQALVEGFLAHVPEPWQLVLAGKPGWLSDAQRERLDELVTSSGGRVVRLGFVSDEELAALYGSAEVFAYPSSYEGFGLPVLEAMTYGLPVVITDAAAPLEVAGDAAEVVPLGPELGPRLGSALARLTGDPAARAELGTRGRARAKEFDWARTTAGVVQAVLSTVDGRPPRLDS
jgi:glycosyltransferase involved in cell wall biosynthesis